MPAQSRWFRIFLLLFFTLLGMLAYLLVLERHQRNASPPLAAVPPGGDFVLQSADGPVALKDFRGKVALLYFGYALCPDVCPTSLSTMAMALKRLKPDEADQVRVIFISVDPKRDTPDRLKEYVQYFHKNMVGVTGEKKDIDDIVRRYGAIYRIADEGSKAGYLVDHSSTTYLIDRSGKLVKLIPHGVNPESLAAILREQISK